jgi:hypothetical protein
MTPQEKAKELVNKYKNPFNRIGCIPPSETMFDSTAKECALIAVDEVMNADWYIPTFEDNKKWTSYWKEVEQEIEKL